MFLQLKKKILFHDYFQLDMNIVKSIGKTRCNNMFNHVLILGYR